MSSAIATVMMALTASSSSRSTWRTNWGTSVAVSTPPSSSSYSMLGVSLA